VKNDADQAEVGQFGRYPSLKGRVVLISGGADGIGAAMVEAFHMQGAKVAFLDVNTEKAAVLQFRLAELTGREPAFEYCDVRDVPNLQAAISAISKNVGSIHTLANNAAVQNTVLANDLTVEQWDRFQEVNLRPVLFASQAVYQDMKKLGGGSIINFTSPTFRRRTAGYAGYAASKAGTEGLTRILAREYGDAGIRVNSIMPGWTATANHRNNLLTAEVESDLMKVQCLKRLILPEDIARLALFLSADDSRFMTAQIYAGEAGLV
jgi:NAD(P)-dependent dehydrogenase (short-subunit alcohol dehydrogenase family)